MGSRPAKTFATLAALITLFCLFPRGLSASYGVTYQLVDRPSGSKHYTLNVAVPESLYEYYGGKDHGLDSNNDFSKFVTPYALEPIADGLWEIYADDEDFANGVLMIVHQIPYEEITPPRYPVETIVDNKGDCDLFSYVAASILKAGGVNVVLLYYESEAHMNIGVSLSHEPHEAREGVDYVTYEGVRFYVAECTGGDWQNGWRVGECPESVKQASVQVITLENCEQSAPGQVSASYKTLEASAIALNVPLAYLIQGSSIALSGRLSPALQNRTITIYVKANSSPWTALGTVKTDYDGNFTYVWHAGAFGACYVRAGWSGDDDYAGADSPIVTLTILPGFFVLLLGVVVVLVGAGAVVFFASKHGRKDALEPQPPEIPS